MTTPNHVPIPGVQPLQILIWPRDAELLRRVARPVREEEFGSEALREFVYRLGTTMMRARGLGLAANQVAEAPGGEPWAVFTLQVKAEEFGVVCNPRIEPTDADIVGAEACLSFASVREMLAAPRALVLHGRDVTGEEFSMPLTGVGARCAFHETQHLEGRVMLDRMGQTQRSMFMRQVAKAWTKASRGVGARR